MGKMRPDVIPMMDGFGHVLYPGGRKHSATVSVIMNCLNGARYLVQALTSVFAQVYQDFEVIFWDDGSTDSSVAIARSFGQKVRTYHGPGGLPLGQSRNLAFGQAEGDYLAILDVDDLWHKHKLGQQVSFLEAHPSVGLLGSDCHLMDAEGHSTRTLFQRIAPPDGQPYRALLTRSNYLASPTLMFRRDVVEKVGGCRATYRYAELYDLCVQVAQVSGVAMLETPLASYRIHPGNRGGTGHVGMTKEVLDVMRRHRDGAPLAQYVREGLLWLRLWWQYAYS